MSSDTRATSTQTYGSTMADVSEGRDYNFDFGDYDAEKTKRSLRKHRQNRLKHEKHVGNAYRLAKASPSQEVAETMEAHWEAYKRTERAIVQGWDHLLELDPTADNEAGMKKALDDLSAARMDIDQMAMHVFGLCRPINKDDENRPAKEEKDNACVESRPRGPDPHRVPEVLGKTQ